MGARMPQQAQPQEQPQGQGDPSSQIGEMITGIAEAMMTLAQIVGQQNPEVGQKLQALEQQYEQIIEEIVGGAGGAESAMPEGQVPAGPMQR